MAEDTQPTAYSIVELKNALLAEFCQLNKIEAVDVPEKLDGEKKEETAIREAAEQKNGRHMMITRFMDELEDDWNMENRELLRETDCPKLFTAADVRRFGGVDKKPKDEAPLAIKDRWDFAAYLETKQPMPQQ